MPQVDWSQFGRQSARTKLEALAVIILLGLALLAYKRGEHNAANAAAVGQLDKERAVVHDTIKIDRVVMAEAHVKSESAHAISAKVIARSDSFRLKPMPTVHLPANDSLIAVILNRDSALAIEKAVTRTLKFEIATLRTERTASEKLVADLNRQADLDEKEISKLKQFKTPRFGWKTGLAVGVVAVIAGERLIKRTP